MVAILVHPDAPPIEVDAAPWNARDRAAWTWPPALKPSAWAEKFRYLVKSAIPGPWRNSNAPYLAGLMDLAATRGVERLTIKKAAQIGVSEALRTLMGFWAQQDPEPMGLLLPNKEKGREIVENEVIPFFRREFGRHTELRELLSDRMHDIKKGQIKLANGFILHLMWSGSPASTASNPMKRAMSDEVDKFAEYAGNDADPVSLVDKRMRTYPDRKHLLSSTPTTADGVISTSFSQSHVRVYFLITCPHCSTRQRMVFGNGGDYGVKWSERVRDLHRQGKHEEAAAAVLAEGVVYQCVNEKCHGTFDEKTKRRLLREGSWGTVATDATGADSLVGDAQAPEKPGTSWGGGGGGPGGAIWDTANIVRFPDGTWVGAQIGSQNACWESWTLAHVAAEFLAARTIAQRFAFTTSTLGETWEQAVETVAEASIERRTKEKSALPEGVVPRWAARLIAVVDTQMDHFWLVIRAWGPGLRSARVWHGRVEHFADIERLCFHTAWANEDPRQPARICDRVLIDSGGTRKQLTDEQMEMDEGPLPSRVMDVYAWALQYTAMVNVIKGDARPEPGKYLRRGTGYMVTDGKGGVDKTPVPLWLLDVHHFQDQLADLMQTDLEVGGRADAVTGEEVQKPELVPAWALNTREDPEYDRHMAAMHKVTLTARGKREQRWRPKRDGMRVDYRACEGYQVAAAFMLGVHLLPPMEAYLLAVEAEMSQRAQPPAPPPPNAYMQTPDGRPFLATER